MCPLYPYSSLNRVAPLQPPTTVPDVKSAAEYVEPRMLHFKKYCVELGNNFRLAEFHIQMGEIAAFDN